MLALKGRTFHRFGSQSLGGGVPTTPVTEVRDRCQKRYGIWANWKQYGQNR